MARKPVIGITIGDVNGIGPEVIIKALADNRVLNSFIPIVYGSSKVLSYYRKMMKMEDFSYFQIKDATDLHSKKVNVINCWEEMVEINVGQETKDAGNRALMAIKRVTEDLKAGKIDAVVTGPINKNNIFSEDFKFKGHTQYFAEAFGAKESLMLLTSGSLRVGLLSEHIPVKDIASHVTKEKVENKLEVLLTTLVTDFGIKKPKIAVLGLNPHAGDGGLIGDEEKNILEPVISDRRNHGELIYGPFSPDGFFGSGQFAKYDAVLAMYHDQGLIPFKTLSFETGVNFTAGISAIRTSPDHGTAYAIAGKNQASENSIRQALFLAADIHKTRQLDVVEQE